MCTGIKKKGIRVIFNNFILKFLTVKSRKISYTKTITQCVSLIFFLQECSDGYTKSMKIIYYINKSKDKYK